MNIRNKLREQAEPFTVKVRFTSNRKTAEYAITEVLDDGFMGTPIGRTQTGATWVPYDKLDYIRILQEGDV